MLLLSGTYLSLNSIMHVLTKAFRMNIQKMLSLNIVQYT